MPTHRAHILVCRGTACISSKSEEVQKSIISELDKNSLSDEIKVLETGCFGFCRLGPIVVVYPEGTFYCEVKPGDAADIVNSHIKEGKIVERLLYREPDTGELHQDMDKIEFFKHQHRTALRNSGIINPHDIEEYIAREGYFSLGKVLTEYKPQEVINIIKKSGLRGRGGGGFPTGLKWELASKSQGPTKYVICNADEGDPGAFMDRNILEGDPHSVLEAMAIAGYAIGANQGYIYVRAEYPVAVERLRTAIKQARDYGLLGKGLFETDFEFDIDLRLGSGAFVCGEETALITSIEGNRGEPRPRPPFPAQKGLWGKPTLINNVETLANIPVIILKGWEWYSSIGTERSKGTKVFAIAGKINNTGLIEVPMGTSLRKVVYEIGGGIPGAKAFKAAQTGGPSGGCIPAQFLDIAIEYDTLLEVGSMMGSGGLIIMDEDDCMVDIAKFYLEFTQDESCGKCPPCRIGTKRMLEIITRITRGEGTENDLELLESMGNEIKITSLCGLGQSAPNPVLSTLKYFRDEYLAHVRDKRCPAGVCKALVAYQIKKDKCKGCTACLRACPVQAISGKPKEEHSIDPEKCIKCGACVEKCRFGAIEK